jgi:hypothetical protein
VPLLLEQNRYANMPQLLESRKIDARADLQREALRMAEEYEKESSRRIFHMQIAMCDLQVRGPKHRGGQGGQYQGGDSSFFQDDGHLLGGSNGHLNTSHF